MLGRDPGVKSRWFEATDITCSGRQTEDFSKDNTSLGRNRKSLRSHETYLHREPNNLSSVSPLSAKRSWQFFWGAHAQTTLKSRRRFEMTRRVIAAYRADRDTTSAGPTCTKCSGNRRCDYPTEPRCQGTPKIYAPVWCGRWECQPPSDGCRRTGNRCRRLSSLAHRTTPSEQTRTLSSAPSGTGYVGGRRDPLVGGRGGRFSSTASQL